MGKAAFLGGAMVAVTASASLAAQQSPAEARRAIGAVLAASIAAWNAGDLDRFMTSYEDSPATSYISGTRRVQGYGAIAAMYRDRFAGGARSAMGTLAVDVLDVRPLGPDYAYLTGRFHLHRDAVAGGDAAGLTTLLFHRTRQGWRIIADHS